VPPLQLHVDVGPRSGSTRTQGHEPVVDAHATKNEKDENAEPEPERHLCHPPRRRPPASRRDTIDRKHRSSPGLCVLMTPGKIPLPYSSTKERGHESFDSSFPSRVRDGGGWCSRGSFRYTAGPRVRVATGHPDRRSGH